MNTREIFFYIMMGVFLAIPCIYVYGDDIPTKGEWNKERYRSLGALPPTVSIEGNVLSVTFTDALENLNVRITDAAGMILYEDVISGNAGDVFEIPLTVTGQGCYRVLLTHKLGWLMGDFLVSD